MIVVDTSVAVKWVVPEAGSDAALDLIGHALAAPDLAYLELAGGLTRKVRRGELTPDQARQAVVEASGRIALLPSLAYGEAAIDLSIELFHSVYDCLFLAAALAHGTVLVTADAKFGAKVKATRLAPTLVMLGEALPND